MPVSGLANTTAMPQLCRDCLWQETTSDRERCPLCHSGRLIKHPQLDQLTIAHIDCDAFYASIEKRDDPSLLHKPVIVGGGRRGVVAAACYVARLYGVRSAMPMFKALQRCPDAVVIKPRMEIYRDTGMRIRQLMLQLTPLVEPLSIDEAFLDMSGTETLHGRTAAASLAGLAQQIEREIGVTVSIGLAATKSLAKMASDMDKPKGFHVIGRTEAEGLLANMPITALFGIGRSLASRLHQLGIETCSQLATADPHQLARIAGNSGPRLQQLARGIDPRQVNPDEAPKSLSSETTFDTDLDQLDPLLARLEKLSAKVSRRLKKAGLSGRRVTLKLKRSDHRLITRSAMLQNPTQLADRIFASSANLLQREVRPGCYWRLIGVGVDQLGDAADADPADLADPEAGRRKALEHAVDRMRDKYGGRALISGRQLGGSPDNSTAAQKPDKSPR